MTYDIPHTNYTQSRNSGYNPYSTVPRGWIIFAQIAGTIFSVLGLIFYISYIQKIQQSISSTDLTNKAVTAVLLAIITYFVWRSIYTAYIIVRFVKQSSDEELCANRYIISALSLGVGGFFTPFLMTSFPNVATTSTIKPRYFLSKAMGFCLLVGSPILGLSYFLTLISGLNAVTGANIIFNLQTTMGIISFVVLTVTILAFIFGIITTYLFSVKKVKNDFDTNNTSKALQVVTTIWMAILTIELAIVILFAILRLVGAVADFFRRTENGGFMIIFALLNLFITFSYVGMAIYITTKTMAGLWSIDANVKIGKYEHNNLAKKRLATNASTY